MSTIGMLEVCSMFLKGTFKIDRLNDRTLQHSLDTVSWHGRCSVILVPSFRSLNL